MTGDRRGSKLSSIIRRKPTKATKAASPVSGRGNGKKPNMCKGLEKNFEDEFICVGSQPWIRSLKKPSIIEIIDISSSCPESPLRKTEEDEVSSPCPSTPIIGSKEVEDIKIAFNNLANLIITHIPNICVDVSPSGIPFATTNPAPAKLQSFQKTAEKKAQPESRLTVFNKLEMHERSQYGTNIERNLLSKFEQCSNKDFYINFKPLPSTPRGRTLDEFVMPKWAPVAFSPPGMLLDEIETTLIAYIFMSDEDNKHGSEILISTEYGIGNRKTLKTLIPNDWVDQEVLNLMAYTLKYGDSAPHSTVWFLPTMFAQFALDWGYKSEIVKRFFQRDFMGKVGCLRKIFIPINDQHVHWYLLVVAFDEKKLILLDSLPSEGRREYRRDSVKELAHFLDDMFMDKSFFDTPTKFKYDISDFALVEPRDLPRQQIGSNDCGVWVAMWMKEYARRDDFYHVFTHGCASLLIW
ncbi:unnamed protein product [Cuscuta epithymum]|uniref:Ubiquitin-like protease family profile domain-containing protein n=1 Tax=Cuscuta epithymum TaxID=186058 RepID=A0AAV0CT17_9ASTE|nr:unnamed protein product [Cuscuta epithymum]